MQRHVRRGWLGLIALTCAGLSGVLCAQVATRAAASATMPMVAPNGVKTFPLADVRRGLHGVAYTVFEGVTPEPMEVEILGVLKDAIGPGQDMILARLKGEKPEYTGVVAGMSGSPVYIDGRLLGALSYRIGQFSKEPICGITPIEQMFEVRDGQARGKMRVASAGEGGQEQGQVQKQIPFGNDNQTAPFRTDNQNAPFGNDDQRRAVSGGGGEVQPIETALVFGGFSQEAVERFGDKFHPLQLHRRQTLQRQLAIHPVAHLRGRGRDEAAGAAGSGFGGECGAGAWRPFDLGDVHGDVCRPHSTTGVWTSDYAVRAGVDADDQG